ncbi:uncharacterized protein [Physcomitrium patens]|uniref:Pentatricopeptide repeat protein n=1 Tax=Physcomitrium patens TaxID=3218 RepID=Q08I95_PHYPA|nr:pentatricopeptide repeat-containing protein At1g01970-like [Physcomitrium patens]BAF34329.1 pentatricopeptide repeat protein [Physcomitrium patens]BAF34330.1 pentatricopeptide repeat protein [Physcomitrium patens]|eukprot:XP_024387286.1 pentatricopeptide repeat-containing protein At1g01970-like [Physcomitrella patens]
MHMGLAVWSGLSAQCCPTLPILRTHSSGASSIVPSIASRTNFWDGRVEVWRRRERAAGWECGWFVESVAESMSIRRGMLVVTNASKRRRWKSEPLVNGSVTKRALHIVKILRSSSNLLPDEIDATLQKWVTSMQPNRKDWLTVLKEFDNRLERLLYLKIFEWGLLQSWFEAGVRDYTKLIDKYGREGNVVEAEQMFRIMEERGIPADLGAFTVLIAAYGRAKMLEKVKQVLQDVSLAGLELDAVFYKTVIVAYGSVGMPKEAEDVLSSMESAGVPDGKDAYLALLNAYGRLGHASDAQRVFDRMHLKGFRGDLKAFTALLEAYSNAQDYANAELVFQSLRAAGLKPDDRALASMVSVYAKANMLNRAAEVIVELEGAGMRFGPVTLTSLIGWFGKAGLVEEAKHCFQELKRKRLPISGKAYANMFAAYARAGELETAGSIWASIEEAGIELDHRECAVMAEALLAGKVHEQSVEIFFEALQARGWKSLTAVEVAVADRSRGCYFHESKHGMVC